MKIPKSLHNFDEVIEGKNVAYVYETPTPIVIVYNVVLNMEVAHSAT